MSSFEDLFDEDSEGSEQENIEEEPKEPEIVEDKKPKQKRKPRKPRQTKPKEEPFMTDEEFEEITTPELERLNFNKLPQRVLKFEMDEEYEPPIEFLMSSYRMLFGKTIRENSETIVTGIIYNAIKLRKHILEHKKK